MKEGFWKKVLVGVAASLITLSAVSLVSSIALAIRPKDEEESITKCTHMKIIEVSGVAPTCTEPGLTDGIFCGVCRGVIKKQEVIDPLGHVSVVVPGYDATCAAEGKTDGEVCGVCDTVLVAQQTISKSAEHHYENGACVDCGMLDLTACVEVEVAPGEYVAGNWYRMYRGSRMNLSGGIINPTYETEICLFAGSAGEAQDSFIQCAGPTSPDSILEGMEYVITDDYIDVYLAPGRYVLSNAPNSSVEITAETTITSINGNIYKLVLPED